VGISPLTVFFVDFGVKDVARFRGLPRLGDSLFPFSPFFFLGFLLAGAFLVVMNKSRPSTLPSMKENEFRLPGVNSCNTLLMV